MAVCATCAYFKVQNNLEGGYCTYHNHSQSKHHSACYYYKKD